MNLNRPELIESYLKGELTGAEKTAFEAQLEQDPLFKSEIELQTDIVNSLKTYRKNQLKDRLNNIDVSGGTTLGKVAALKYAASLVVIGLLSYGSYVFLLSENEQEKVAAKQEVIQEKQEVEAPEVQENPAVLNKTETKPNIIPDEIKVPEKKKPIAKRESKEVVISPNVIDTFDANEIIVKNSDFDNSLENSASPTDKFTDVEIRHEDSKGKELKYKYLNKKLYLYGDFSDAPYELIELNSTVGKKLFLYHNDSYYQLSENQKIVTPLNPIYDSLIIQELDSLKGQK